LLGCEVAVVLRASYLINRLHDKSNTLQRLVSLGCSVEARALSYD
jgi:hypothetical protein